MLRDRRVAGLVKLHRRDQPGTERQVWAGRTKRAMLPLRSLQRLTRSVWGSFLPFIAVGNGTGVEVAGEGRQCGLSCRSLPLLRLRCDCEGLWNEKAETGP